jgi:hypothetical protein
VARRSQPAKGSVETETDSDGMISMKVEFETNELAEQFRQSFGGSYTA